jgi:phospholipase D1/2
MGVDKNPDRARETVEHAGSRCAASQNLQDEDGMLRVQDDVANGRDAATDEADTREPEAPLLERLIDELAPGAQRSGPAWGKLAAIVLLIAALAALWRHTPLSEFATAERIIGWAHDVGTLWWAPAVVMAAYTPAAFVMFPRPLITLFAVIAFGPVPGLIYSLLGILGAALATYFVGRALPRNTVRRLAGDKLNEMTDVLRRRGLLAIFAVRIVPVAPFAVEGMVAGAIRIRLWHYALGTLLGMLPGTLTTTVFGDQIQTALADPSQINYWLVGGVALLFVVLIIVVRRWFVKQHRVSRVHEPRPA